MIYLSFTEWTTAHFCNPNNISMKAWAAVLSGHKTLCWCLSHLSLCCFSKLFNWADVRTFLLSFFTRGSDIRETLISIFPVSHISHECENCEKFCKLQILMAWGNIWELITLSAVHNVQVKENNSWYCWLWGGHCSGWSGQAEADTESPADDVRTFRLDLRCQRIGDRRIKLKIIIYSLNVATWINLSAINFISLTELQWFLLENGITSLIERQSYK